MSAADAMMLQRLAGNRATVSAADAMMLQRLAGNRATAARIHALEAADRIQALEAADDAGGSHVDGPAAPGRLHVARGTVGDRTTSRSRQADPSRRLAVQRLDIYGRAAAVASPLPADTAAAFQRQVDAGDQAMALSVVVAAMTGRGDLDPRPLRTSGVGDLWQVRDVGGLTALVSFRPAFTDPDDPSRRLPNPRFSVSPEALRRGRPDGLERLHTSILHEYRHVQQASERANRPPASGAGVEPGYGNDPDEFDAYVSEVESSYTRSHMTTAALQAGVHWEFLAAADRVPFRARWTAAQARIRSVLGYEVDAILRTSLADQYRERLREMERRGREARERHAP